MAWILSNKKGSGGSGGSEPHNYSTNEQIVGTWIDGSHVYEKTFVINTPSTGDNLITHNISNLGDVVSIYGTAKRSDNVTQPLGYIISTASWNVAVYDFSTTKFTLDVGSSLSVIKVIVTVRYTRTST